MKTKQMSRRKKWLLAGGIVLLVLKKFLCSPMDPRKELCYDNSIPAKARRIFSQQSA